MPELPEVEVVRRGLARWVRGRTITGVEVLDARSIRRHALGTEDFIGNLENSTVLDVVRRGKFLWMPLRTEEPGGTASTPEALPGVALMAHLGMSGQLLMQDPGVPDEKHLKVRLRLSSADGMPEQLRFVDQRIFGGLFVTSLVPTPDGGPGGQGETPFRKLPKKPRTSPAILWIRTFPLMTSTARSNPARPGSSGPCWTRVSSRG